MSQEFKNNLRAQTVIALFSIQQWSFTEVGKQMYTNTNPFTGQSKFEFHFQVVYEGSISWSPKLKFTEPPVGDCTVLYVHNFIIYE